MSLARTVSVGVAWSGGAQVVSRLASLAVGVVLARLLQPEAFGMVALAGMSMRLIALCGDLGITTALVQRKDPSAQHFTTGFKLALGSSLVLTLLGMGVAPMAARICGEPRVAPLMRVMLLGLPIAAAGQISLVFLQRKLDFRKIAFVNMSAAVLSGTTGVSLALAGAGTWSLVGQALSFGIAITCGRFIAAPWRPRGRFDPALVKDVLAFGASAVGGALLNFAVTNIDNAVVGRVLGASALGVYLIIDFGRCPCVQYRRHGRRRDVPNVFNTSERTLALAHRLRPNASGSLGWHSTGGSWTVGNCTTLCTGCLRSEVGLGGRGNSRPRRGRHLPRTCRL